MLRLQIPVDRIEKMTRKQLLECLSQQVLERAEKTPGLSPKALRRIAYYTIWCMSIVHFLRTTDLREIATMLANGEI